jgi:hypothetical protein
MAMNDDERYRFTIHHDAPFSAPLVIERVGTDERLAELDVTRGPAVPGPSPSIEMDESVCTAVFGGHHWQHVTQEAYKNERRVCALCGKAQRKVGWVDDE